MSKRRNTLGYILVVGAALATVAAEVQAQRGGGRGGGAIARPPVAGPGAPGAGVWDPGVNQPGAAGNVGGGAPGAGVWDPGVNQPGTAGNVGAGVIRRRIVASSTIVYALPPGCTTVEIEGVALLDCGGIYYQPYGSQYQMVTIE